MAKLDTLRDSKGQLPAFAWPGGYPLIYQTQDGGILCPTCANGGNDSDASTARGTDPQWHVVDGDVYWEGAALQCDHCYAPIESAYGDPDADDSN